MVLQNSFPNNCQLIGILRRERLGAELLIYTNNNHGIADTDSSSYRWLAIGGTMQDDEQTGRRIMEYQNQAKILFRKLGSHSPTRCSIESGPYLLHYLIVNDVCYLVMVDKMYSKRLAFNYLEDLAQEFHTTYGRKVNSVTRPYAFIEFDVYIQKAKNS